MYTPGMSIADRYRLETRLATGGMGDIWSAQDTVLGRPVAIKLVKPEFADDAGFRRRLVAEARSAAAVSDPHVVEIYDVGDVVTNEGRRGSYIAMALVAGRPVSDLIASELLPATEAADVMRQVATALAASHACGVIHRDIKPGNLMRDATGTVTVLDFGIARAADAANLTATGELIGTARYMSPEQVSGQPATSASDIYALGVVAYQCLTGVPPFDGGSDVATALAHRDQPAPPLPDGIPRGLASLVESCLAKDPAARPTAAEIVAAASSYTGATLEATPTAVIPVPAAPPEAETDAATAGAPAWFRRRRVAGVATAVAAAIAVAVIIGIVTDGSPSATASGHHPRRPSAAATKPDTVAVRASHYLGEQYSVAAAQLSGRGLTPIATGSAVSAGALVASVSPTGAVKRGTPITLALSAPAASVPVTSTKPAKVPPTKPVKVPPGQAKKDDGGHGWHGEGDDG